jgi:hypothetical protein
MSSTRVGDHRVSACSVYPTFCSFHNKQTYFFVWVYTPRYKRFLEGLEHLKIETRLIDERFTSVMGECVIMTLKVCRLYSMWSVMLEPHRECSESWIWTGRRTLRSGGGRVHCLIPEVELLKLQNIGQFPDETVKIEDPQILYVSSQMYYQYQS